MKRRMVGVGYVVGGLSISIISFLIAYLMVGFFLYLLIVSLTVLACAGLAMMVKGFMTLRLLLKRQQRMSTILKNSAERSNIATYYCFEEVEDE